MLSSSIWIALGIGLLYAGAEGLVRGSVSAARRLGVSPLVIGLTVVAFGTSMPEMVVSVGAAVMGNGPIAVGNVVGSNIANIGLILGLAALIRPPRVEAKIIRVDVPIVLGVSALFVFLVRDGRLVRPEGAVLLAGLVVYTALTARAARAESERVKAEFGEAVPAAIGSPILDPVLIVAGLGLLALGAHLLVLGAVSIAQELGIPEAVIGLTIVAVGTSLPELATSVVAAARGEGDIALGNVIGSNLFNTLGIAGAAALARPLRTTGIAALDLVVMVGLTVVLLPLMRTGFRVSRGEGVVLFTGYVAYVAWLLG